MWVPCATTSARDTGPMENNELFQNIKPRLRLSEDTEMPKIGRNLMPSHQGAGQSPVVRDIVQRAGTVSDDFAWERANWPTRFENFMEFPLDRETTMEGIRDQFDAGR